MIVHVKEDSESGDTIATLNINADDLIKHVKEQIEATTGIHTAKQCLLHRFDNGGVNKLWQCRGNGKISSYHIKDGSTLVLQYSFCGRRTLLPDVHAQRMLLKQWKWHNYPLQKQKSIRYPLSSAAAKQRWQRQKLAEKQVLAAAERCTALMLSESTGAPSSQ